MFLIYQVSRVKRNFFFTLNSFETFFIIAMMFREGQAPRPTKSEWDSVEKLIDGADGEQSLSLATDRVERILTLIKSQNVAIYNKK